MNSIKNFITSTKYVFCKVSKLSFFRGNKFDQMSKYLFHPITIFFKSTRCSPKNNFVQPTNFFRGYLFKKIIQEKLFYEYFIEEIKSKVVRLVLNLNPNQFCQGKRKDSMTRDT